ncbi:hypothetical protein HMI55_000798 [Coelomomyces lativittatus]|nr:hypothetical protein HMI55_000798 [Coelomomyces lativittatus]
MKPSLPGTKPPSQPKLEDVTAHELKYHQQFQKLRVLALRRGQDLKRNREEDVQHELKNKTKLKLDTEVFNENENENDEVH